MAVLVFGDVVGAELAVQARRGNDGNFQLEIDEALKNRWLIAHSIPGEPGIISLSIFAWPLPSYPKRRVFRTQGGGMC